MVDETEFDIMDAEHESWLEDTDIGYCPSCEEEFTASETQESCPICGCDGFTFVW